MATIRTGEELEALPVIRKAVDNLGRPWGQIEPGWWVDLSGLQETTTTLVASHGPFRAVPDDQPDTGWGDSPAQIAASMIAQIDKPGQRYNCECQVGGVDAISIDTDWLLAGLRAIAACAEVAPAAAAADGTDGQLVDAVIDAVQQGEHQARGYSGDRIRALRGGARPDEVAAWEARWPHRDEREFMRPLVRAALAATPAQPPAPEGTQPATDTLIEQLLAEHQPIAPDATDLRWRCTGCDLTSSAAFSDPTVRHTQHLMRLAAATHRSASAPQPVTDADAAAVGGSLLGKDLCLDGLVHRLEIMPNENETGWIVVVEGAGANLPQPQAEVVARLLTSGPLEEQR